MIDKVFIKAPEYVDYLENKDKIYPESLVFIDDKDQLITQNKKYEFVPASGEDGQFLLRTNDGLIFKTIIYDELGDSKDKVLSQKFVSEYLKSLEDNEDALKAAIDNLDSYVNGAVFVHYTDEHPFDNETNFRNALDERFPVLDHGLVRPENLPSYVDDVIEFEKELRNSDWADRAVEIEIGKICYCSSSSAGEFKNKFIRNTNATFDGLEIVEPEFGKIYVNINDGNNKIYRWSGSSLIEISKTTYGRTNETAFRGDWGKALEDKVSTLAIYQNLKDNSNYSPEDADKYSFEHGEEIDNFQLTFTPLSPLSLTMPEDVGDLPKGTTSESLNGKTISEILDSILFKTIYPTVTNPSLTISGSTTSPQKPTNTIWSGYGYNFNKGNVAVNDGVTQSTNYVGDIVGSPTYQVNYTLAATNSTEFPIWNSSDKPTAISNGSPSVVNRYEVGQYQYRVSINYSAGPLMKTSKGATPNPMPTTNANSVTNPHPAGSLTSSYGATINISLPVYIDNGNGNYVEQALKNWGAWTFTGVQMGGTTVAKPIKIKTPRSLKTANSFNAVSGKYDVQQLSNFSKKQITEPINGVNYIYFEYIWNGAAADAVAYEIITN